MHFSFVIDQGMQRAINHINFCIVFVYTDCITDACVAVWYFPVSIEVCGHTVISKVFPYLQETAVVKNPKVYNIKEKGVIFHPVGTYFYSFVSSVCVNGCLLYFQVISTSILYSLVLNERHRTCNGLRSSACSFKGVDLLEF